MSPKLTAEQFRDLCHGVQDATASLGSCHDRETPAEAEHLRRYVIELRGAALKRASRDLEKLRDSVIHSAMLVHARRGGEATP